MSSGLCSVLKSIRGSMDSDSDSDNDHDVTDDVDPPSWHGSMQHLASTSESEAGNCSSESFLCDHCGKHSNKGDNNSSNNSNQSPASGRPPFPSRGKRGVRTKKRAHFAVDTDNSSDNADKMSDGHESSPSSTTFKTSSGPSQLIMSTTRRGSLSPREIKPASTSDRHQNRPSPPFTRSSSISTDRGRQPFKANHQLFKLPPKGAASASSALPTGSPALPPRQIHRNHFKLQRRNSMSHEERGKLPFQTFVGKPDGKTVRSASATREIGSKNDEKDDPQFETEAPHQKVAISHCKSYNVSSSKTENEYSITISNDIDNSRELPNYDEAVARVSLLRWASLQKLPSKSSGENLSSSSSKEIPSPTNDASSSKTRSIGNVGKKVKSFEERATSMSSGSNCGSVTADKHSNSWNHNSFGNSVSYSGNSVSYSGIAPDQSSINTEYTRDSPKITRDNNMSTSYDYLSENSSVFRLRRDNSSTLSDDVFAYDDSGDNFADSSWSPGIAQDEKGAISPGLLRPYAPAINSLATPLPTSHRVTPMRDHDASSSLTYSECDSSGRGRNIKPNGSNNTVAHKNSVGSGSGRINNHLNPHNNAPSLPNGKRIVLEVLV